MCNIKLTPLYCIHESKIRRTTTNNWHSAYTKHRRMTVKLAQSQAGFITHTSGRLWRSAISQIPYDHHHLLHSGNVTQKLFHALAALWLNVNITFRRLDFNTSSRCPCNKLTQYTNVFSRKSNVNNYTTVMEAK